MAARHWLVAVTFSLSMLLYVDRIAISLVKAPLSAAFGLTDTQFGWVLSAFALGYALFQTPAGALADRHGPRLVLALVVGLWSVFTALTGLTWSVVSLLICRFLFGAAEAGAYPTIARAFYAWLPVRERGLAQGINFSGSRLGAAFALPAIAWLLTATGWRTAFLLLGVFGLAWAMAWLAWFRDTPEQHAGVSPAERAAVMAAPGSDRPRQPSPDAGTNTGTNTDASTDADTRANAHVGAVRAAAPAIEPSLWRSPNVWIAMGQYFASNFTFFFCLTWLFPHLQRTYQLEALATGALASAPLVGGAVGNWVGGAAVDALYRRGYARPSRQWPAIIGFLLAAGGLLASLAFDRPVPVVFCLTVAIFGADMTLPPSWAFAIDIGRARAGAVTGTMNMAGNLGSFVTSLAFPYLLAISGSTMPFFLTGVALNLAAAWLWTRVRPESEQPELERPELEHP